MTASTIFRAETSMTSWSYDFSRMRIFLSRHVACYFSVVLHFLLALLHAAAEAFEVVTTTRRTS